MENRIKELFKSKKGNLLSVYYTAGFPKLNDTLPIAVGLERAGVDIIEIGIPFSDPIADGPTIQESNKIALDNGMNLHLLLEQVQEIRRGVSIPIILISLSISEPFNFTTASIFALNTLTSPFMPDALCNCSEPVL